MSVAKISTRLATALLLNLAAATAPARAEGEQPAPPAAPQTAGVELELPAAPEAPAAETPAPAPMATPEQPPTAVTTPGPAPAPSTSVPQPATAPSETSPAPEAGLFAGAALVNAAAPFTASVHADHADGVYRLGERLRVEFVSEQPAHLYVLYHQADGVTKLLFPNRVHAAARVGEAAPVLLPADGEAFRFRIGLPLGKETLQVLAASQPIAELDQIDRPADRAPVVEPTVIAALAARIKTDPTLWAEHHTSIETVPGIGGR